MATVDVLSIEDLAKLGAVALRDAVEGRADLDHDKLRDMLRHGVHGLRTSQSIPEDSLDEIFTTALSSIQNSVLDYNVHHLPRWFEIHPDDYPETPVDQLRAEVLFRHVYYEQMLKGWFEEWGYEVEVGETLSGVEGTEFVPDLYAKLDTLRGNFVVAVSLFCAVPASTTGVLAKLENFEGYAIEGSHFSHGDLFILATPHEFKEQATNQMRLQTREETYAVVPLEGAHFEGLERARDALDRKVRLGEYIRDWLARTARENV